MTTITATPFNIAAQLTTAAKGGVDGLSLVGDFSRITLNGLKPPAPIVLDCSKAMIGWALIEGCSGVGLVGGEFTAPPYNCIQICDSDHISVSAAYFHDWPSNGAAITALRSSFLTYRANRFTRSQGDAIDTVSSHDVDIFDNRFSNLTYVAGGNHTDAMQFWANTGEPTLANIQVWRNHMVAEAQFCGVYSNDNTVSGISLRDNVSASNMTWGGCHFTNLTPPVAGSVPNECVGNFAMTLLGETHGWQPPTWMFSGSGPITVSGNTNGVAP